MWEGEVTVPNLEKPPTKKPRLDATESTLVIKSSSNDDADTSKWLDTLTMRLRSGNLASAAKDNQH